MSDIEKVLIILSSVGLWVSVCVIFYKTMELCGITRRRIQSLVYVGIEDDALLDDHPALMDSDSDSDSEASTLSDVEV